MSLREIVLWPDARLTQPCVPVAEITPDVSKLAQDMLETMYNAPGRGLAAPQVGEMMRLFVMDSTWKDDLRNPRVFINPVILSASDDTAPFAEGCLSIPGVTAEIERPTTVRMQWTDLEGVTQDAEFEGFDAVCVQHEADHLDGIVTLNRLTGEERARVLQTYSDQNE